MRAAHGRATLARAQGFERPPGCRRMIDSQSAGGSWPCSTCLGPRRHTPSLQVISLMCNGSRAPKLRQSRTSDATATSPSSANPRSQLRQTPEAPLATPTWDQGCPPSPASRAPAQVPFLFHCNQIRLRGPSGSTNSQVRTNAASAIPLRKPSGSQTRTARCGSENTCFT